MEELPQNNSEQPAQLDPAMQSLADMAGQMGENAEKEAPIGEKYYEQARAERERWVEESREELAKAEELKPSDMKVAIFGKNKFGEKIITGYRAINEDNPEDMVGFERKKAQEIKRAKEDIKRDEDADLDRIAQCYYNEDLMVQIKRRLENNEDFTEDQIEFLNRDNRNVFNEDSAFPEYTYMPPADWKTMSRGKILLPPQSYRELLTDEFYHQDTRRSLVLAQRREILKQDRIILHENEEIQGALENMEERREANPFAGETNIDSETGETRTFTLEDNYPRLEGESEEAYADRLKRIGLKTRLAEKRQ